MQCKTWRKVRRFFAKKEHQAFLCVFINLQHRIGHMVFLFLRLPVLPGFAFIIISLFSLPFFSGNADFSNYKSSYLTFLDTSWVYLKLSAFHTLIRMAESSTQCFFASYIPKVGFILCFNYIHVLCG